MLIDELRRQADDVYQEAQKFLDTHNPCEWQDSTCFAGRLLHVDTNCCHRYPNFPTYRRPCSFLGKQGCKLARVPLICKVSLCTQVHIKLKAEKPLVYEEYNRIIRKLETIISVGAAVGIKFDYSLSQLEGFNTYDDICRTR